MNIFKKIQPLIFALVCMLAAAGLFFGLWYVIEDQGLELKDQAQTIADEKSFQSQYHRLVESVNRTETDRRTLESYVLLDDGDTIELLSRLDEIAAAQGVELATSQLQLKESEGNYNQLQLSYRLGGPEAAVVRLISLFETLPLHSHVTSVNIDRSKVEGDVGPVSANVSLLLTIAKYD